MKKIIFFLSYLCSIMSISNAGATAGTIIQTIDGAKEIRILQESNQVICFDNKLEAEAKKIISIESKTMDTIIEITTADDVVIRVAPEQKFFVTHKWVNAEDLSLSDVLITKNKTFVGIKSIRHLQEEETFYFIEVEDHHNFLATENGILVHNGTGGAAVGFWVGRSLGWTGGAICAGVMAAPALAGGPLAYGVAYTATMGTIAPVVESAAQTASLAGAIIGATITGPV